MEGEGGWEWEGGKRRGRGEAEGERGKGWWGLGWECGDGGSRGSDGGGVMLLAIPVGDAI